MEVSETVRAVQRCYYVVHQQTKRVSDPSWNLDSELNSELMQHQRQMILIWMNQPPNSYISVL